MLKVDLRTCLHILALGVWLVSSENATRVNLAPDSTAAKSQPLSREATFEEYDGGDRDLLFDNFKIYEDGDHIEKGIRKLDTSVEHGAEKLEPEVAKSGGPTTASPGKGGPTGASKSGGSSTASQSDDPLPSKGDPPVAFKAENGPLATKGSPPATKGSPSVAKSSPPATKSSPPAVKGPSSNATDGPKAASQPATKLLPQSADRAERRNDVVDSEEQTIFEDSEIENRKPNVSGTLVTKLIPEILKYNGRMVLPSSEEQPDPAHRRERKTAAISEAASVVQKLTPRRVRHESHNRVAFVPPSKSSFQLANISRLEEIFDLYNPYRLLDIWNDNEELEVLTPECRSQMQMYLVALRAGESWAIKNTLAVLTLASKLDKEEPPGGRYASGRDETLASELTLDGLVWDASGHYSGGYFWGNQYWMGSRTLCREIAEEHPELPFDLEFSVAKTNLTVNLPLVRKHGQNQFVGICLPYVCSKFDVHVLVQQSMISSPAEDDRKAEIIKIKSHYDHYYMTHDPTFWLVIISSIIVSGLLLVGTVLDMMLQKKKFCRDGCRKNYKYDNYTYAVNPPLQPYADNEKAEADGCISERRSTSSGAVTPISETEDGKSGLWQEVFLSFSVIRNMRQICDSSIGADTIPIIHGLRSISMGWVILGHTCIVAFKYSDNMDFRKVVERELLFQTINNTAFTVDTFFFISGLLVSFLYFRTMAKVNVNKITKATGFLSHCIEFVGLLIYRFCRLTVPYIFTLGLVEISMKWFHYNSVFDPPADDHINCPNYWWRNLLFINTLFPVKDMCMLWSWYLADDTQFYILGVVLLILAVRHFRAASISVGILLVVSWCITGYIAYLNNHMPNIDDPLALFDKIYDKPWTRFGPYLIGMIVGWILFKTDCKISMKKPFVILGWTLCTIAMLSLVYGLYNTQLNSITAAAYSSLSHTAWAIGLSWIVIACTTGHGGFMNKILSSKLLIPFSRTTYCAYLVHPIIIRWVVMRRDSPVHLAEETIAIMFLGQLVASYILAFVLSITFEAPIVSLLKLVSPTKRNKLQ